MEIHFKVQRIKAEQTYHLRHQILRPHQSFQACQYDTDHDSGAFHIGAFHKRELVSVASFYPESHPELADSHPYRLRAMATVEEYRGKGAGREVVTFGESELKHLAADLLWCKGRTSVKQYYERLGFQPFGEAFDYPSLGPHVIMYKELR
ncbi:GNAT family N-acetyltransferase [Halobacillus sp. ACCC02827]|uniref:GNAT family N-acetyltransferase n=1 Tax=Bacillaceae TaxID=186817 RepID=UPI0004084F07|nr:MULTISPECIES: GNAT family N-acetyltransferase [Bacillaceae]QHT46178.1 GNAT family N-acetyltransferase [Bacillus sp. SB49]WJE16994.1 GNAT family N-acetyltransferase [Halobacillus sp. ACCC02827]